MVRQEQIAVQDLLIASFQVGDLAQAAELTYPPK